MKVSMTALGMMATVVFFFFNGWYESGSEAPFK